MKGLTEIREYFEILKNMCVCLSLCEPFNSSLYKNGSCILAKKIKGNERISHSTLDPSYTWNLKEK